MTIRRPKSLELTALELAVPRHQPRATRWDAAISYPLVAVASLSLWLAGLPRQLRAIPHKRRRVVQILFTIAIVLAIVLILAYGQAAVLGYE